MTLIYGVCIPYSCGHEFNVSRPVLWQDDGQWISGGRLWCEYWTSDLCLIANEYVWDWRVLPVIHLTYAIKERWDCCHFSGWSWFQVVIQSHVLQQMNIICSINVLKYGLQNLSSVQHSLANLLGTPLQSRIMQQLCHEFIYIFSFCWHCLKGDNSTVYLLLRS